jgi:hypothetical protein
MNMNLLQHEKEVIALDADDHLLRPLMIRLTISELQLMHVRVDRVRTRRLSGSDPA